jgi:hypothetical protein
MREIVTHRDGSPLNAALTLLACDEVNAEGAPYEYIYCYPQANIYVPGERMLLNYGLRFQAGDPADGVNGTSTEVLLAIVLDRLQCVQAGPSPCPENGNAVQCVEQALEWLRLASEHRRERKEEQPPA